MSRAGQITCNSQCNLTLHRSIGQSPLYSLSDTFFSIRLTALWRFKGLIVLAPLESDTDSERHCAWSRKGGVTRSRTTRKSCAALMQSLRNVRQRYWDLSASGDSSNEYVARPLSQRSLIEHKQESLEDCGSTPSSTCRLQLVYSCFFSFVVLDAINDKMKEDAGVDFKRLTTFGVPPKMFQAVQDYTRSRTNTL